MYLSKKKSSWRKPFKVTIIVCGGNICRKIFVYEKEPREHLGSLTTTLTLLFIF